MSTLSQHIIGDDEALPHLRDDDPLFMLDLPSEVVRRGTAIIQPPHMPNYVKHPTVLAIYDVKFNDIGKMWFYISDKKMKKERDDLQDRLNEFYGTCTSLKMRIINAIAGQYCAVDDSYSSSWLRGEIVENIRNDRFVKVRLIDVGFTKVIHVSKICFLVDQFVKPRQQIFYGSLEIDPEDYHLLSNWYLSVGVILADPKIGCIKLKLFDGVAKNYFEDPPRVRRLSKKQKRIQLCEQAHFKKVTGMLAEAENGDQVAID